MAATWQRSISSNLKTEQVKWIKDYRLAIKRTFSRGIKWENLLTKGSQSEQRILFILPACGFSHVLVLIMLSAGG